MDRPLLKVRKLATVRDRAYKYQKRCLFTSCKKLFTTNYHNHEICNDCQKKYYENNKEE